MKHCSSCGNRLKDTDRFCTECGSKVMPESETSVGQKEVKEKETITKLQRGSYTYPDGTRYEGQLLNGKKHGRGIWVRPDGMKYDGEWEYDKPNGQGTLTSPDGKKRTGEWKDGKMVAESNSIEDQAYKRQRPEEDKYYREERTNANIKNKNGGKPLGIVLIAIWNALGGVIGILGGITLIAMGSAMTLLGVRWPITVGIFLILLSVFEFAACYGIFSLIAWGRTLTIVISIIAIPFNLGSITILQPPGMNPSSGEIYSALISIALSVIVIWYLSKDNIKSLFRG